ncbi:MAG: hypothetical protein HQK72_00825 [Desulfamplus sp.]|nr:hypothetical protein [Desulfamplus sp.]
MQAILNVKNDDINHKLLDIIKELLFRNVEIIIRKENFKLEEYDKQMSLDSVVKELTKAGYSQDFVNDVKEGLETSTVYLEK